MTGKWTIIVGCLIYIVGVVLQVATNGLGLIVAGKSDDGSSKVAGR